MDTLLGGEESQAAGIACTYSDENLQYRHHGTFPPQHFDQECSQLHAHCLFASWCHEEQAGHPELFMMTGSGFSQAGPPEVPMPDEHN